MAKNKGNFKVGDVVRIISDNESYTNYLDKDLVITYKATNTKEHPGFDSACDGMGLYDLEVLESGECVPFSLYDFEIK